MQGKVAAITERNRVKSKLNTPTPNKMAELGVTVEGLLLLEEGGGREDDPPPVSG